MSKSRHFKNSNFLGKRLLFFVAHPDDEGYECAGTIYPNYLAGGELYLICATLGEKGASHLKNPVSESRLRNIRKKELRQAAKFIKVAKNLF